MPDHPAAESTPETCPECHQRLTTFRAVRWCSACEWNLDRYDPDRHDRPFGWRWIDRLAHRAAYRLNRRQFAALTELDLAAPRLNPARLTMIVTSTLMLVAVLAMLVVGIRLVVVDFPSLRLVPGVVLILLALVLRPRFGRIDPLLEPLTAAQAPTLFRLIDQVADAVGAPAPHVVGVARSFNASAGAVGLRRRRVLTLGLPLWVSLAPQQRVALLAHELGHFANGDIRRMPITQLALTTTAGAVEVTRPSHRQLDEAGGLYLPMLFAHLVMWLVSRALAVVYLVLVWISLRDSQRAEYLADHRAATVAGSAGMGALLDRLVIGDAVTPMVARAARQSDDVGRWRDAARASHERVAGQLAARHQLSVSTQASLFASHPPHGLRRRMVNAKQVRDARVVLTETQSAQIDAELAGHLSRARRDIGNLG